MKPIRSYVIRIYRSGRSGLAGVVEDVKSGRTRPFHSAGELWEALRMGQREREPSPPPPSPDQPEIEG